MKISSSDAMQIAKRASLRVWSFPPALEKLKALAPQTKAERWNVAER